jgi:hypothetical protein
MSVIGFSCALCNPIILTLLYHLLIMRSTQIPSLISLAFHASYAKSSIIYYISHITYHTSSIICHISYIIFYLSHITRHISLVIYDLSYVIFLLLTQIYHFYPYCITFLPCAPRMSGSGAVSLPLMRSAYAGLW